MEGSTIQISEHDTVRVQQLWKYPVPTAHEVKLFFDYLPDHSKELIGHSLIGIQGMRPTEVPRKRWHWFTYNKEKNQILEHRHLVYKPTCRKGAAGNQNICFKEIKKPIWSNWLSQQIINYGKIAPTYEGNKLFPWTTRDILDKTFKILREKVIKGKLPEEYRCFLDQNSYSIIGNPRNKYRLHPYSLRRFAITFHHWVTFQGDLALTSKTFGHSKPETTFKHYIMPQASIGLTKRMIENKINIDEFIHLKGKKQMRLIDFVPNWQNRILPAGQRTLTDFSSTLE